MRRKLELEARERLRRRELDAKGRKLMEELEERERLRRRELDCMRRKLKEELEAEEQLVKLKRLLT